MSQNQNNLDDLERILEQRAAQNRQQQLRPQTAFQPEQRTATRKSRRRRQNFGCLLVMLISAFAVVGLALAYLYFPQNTSILIIGLDRALDDSDQSRSDSIIYTTINEMEGSLTAFSLPRDLWVTLPDGTQNRINTAHFFAEIEQPGAGPQALISTLDINFDLETNYYLRLNFAGFESLVDAIGGIEITLTEDTGTLTAGTHVLNGKDALAFVRDRKGSDDFFRMERGQQFLKASLEQALAIENILNWPTLLTKLENAVDTNIPPWQIPRVLYVLLRALPDQVNAHTLSRDMTEPFTTAFGAEVLLPIWEKILPELEVIFP